MATTRTVTGFVARPNGAPWPQFQIDFVLTPATATTSRTLPTETVPVVTDADGTFSIELVTGVQYEVRLTGSFEVGVSRVTYPTGTRFTISVPDGDGPISLETLRAAQITPPGASVVTLLEPITADVTSLQSDVTTLQTAKADQATVDAALAAKADVESVTALAGTVATKADAAAVTALTPGAGKIILGGAAGPVAKNYADASIIRTLTRLLAASYLGDDFERPDTPGSNSPTDNGIGNGWNVTGSGYLTARLSDGAVIGDDTIYVYRQLPFTPTRMSARVSFPNTTRPLTLISSVDNGLFANAVHIVFGPTQCVLQKRVSNVSTALAAVIPLAIPTDGSYHDIAWELNGSTVTAFVDGVAIGSATDAQLPSLMGPWCSWEILGTPAGPSSRIDLAEAIKQL